MAYSLVVKVSRLVSFFIAVLMFIFSGEALCMDNSSIVLVNSSSSSYSDFEEYIKPYLDNFGIPYVTHDIALAQVTPQILDRALIIIGHNGLDENSQFLDGTEQSFITAAVAAGSGLVNFDGHLADADLSPRYQYIQDIFNLSYIASVNPSSVTIEAGNSGQRYIAQRHGAGEIIAFKGAVTVQGIIPPSDAEIIVSAAGSPFVIARQYGQGRAVNWGAYEFADLSILGYVYGMDDLVWRSLVWPARKPFALQGLPPIVTFRIDDCRGPFWWAEDAVAHGLKPWFGFFLSDLDAPDLNQMRALIDSGLATASVHAFSQNDFFYFNHQLAADYDDITIANNFTLAANWHAANQIPISNFVLPHYYEMGKNVFNYLENWGVQFVGTHMLPGSGYFAAPKTPWLNMGPYRNFSYGYSDSVEPVYYADVLSVPGHPEHDNKFFNLITEIRDNAGYEWYPDNDVAGSIDRGVVQLKRAFDSMALGTLFTHEEFPMGITRANWNSILSGVLQGVGPYNPLFLTMDDAARYVRAVYTSDILHSEGDASGGKHDVTMTGFTDVPTKIYLFTEDSSGNIQESFADVPPFNGSAQVSVPLSTVPVEITINLWEDTHQEPVLAAFTDPGLLNSTDGLWDEFDYTSRPYPTILAGHDEWETSGLQPMHFHADGIMDGRYAVWANLYTGRHTRHYYAFNQAELLTNSMWVDNVAGAGGADQHDEYQLGVVDINGGRFDLWAGDGDILSGSAYFYGWAWVRLVPEISGGSVNKLLVTNNTAIAASNPVAGDTGIIMQRFQVDSDNVDDGKIELVSINLIDSGLAADIADAKLYISTLSSSTLPSGAVLIGNTGSWDGSSTAITMYGGTAADRTVTAGSSKYIYIVYDLTAAQAGKTIRANVTSVTAAAPDAGWGNAGTSNLLTIQACAPNGSLAISPGQTYSGNPVDLTSGVTSGSAINIVYSVFQSGSCPVQDDEAIITKQDIWKYDIDNSGTGWIAPGYDDSGWLVGSGIFGTEPNLTITTPISNTVSAMFFRNTFNVCDPAEVTELELNSLYDDGMAVYVNGTLVYSEGVAGNPPLYNGGAVGHEAVNYETKDLAGMIGLDALRGILIAGNNNVISVGVYNWLDFVANPPLISSDIAWDAELLISHSRKGSPLFTGNASQAQAADTSGWTDGEKMLEVKGEDAVCHVPLVTAYETIVFHSSQVSETDCFDGVDNDGDGTTDCADSECAGFTDGACTTGQPGICSDGTITCQTGAALCISVNQPLQEVCNDGLDNDCDGMTDLNDSDCVAAPQILFKEDFESGRLGPQWGTKSTGSGRIQVTTSNGPCGGRYHLTMDTSRSNRYSLNELALTMDLAGKTGVTLGFNHKEYGDEDHVMPAVFSGSSNSDGVAISADGQTWYRVQGLTGSDGNSSSCRNFTVDLDAAAAAAGIGYTSTFRIKFQQYDNYPISSDGFAFDDIELQAQASETDCFDGIDSDGDGMTDCADSECAGVKDGACTTGQAGICSAGSRTCQAGAEVCAADSQPQAEACDSLDNDCDGVTDNGFNLGESCSVGVGACVNAGQYICAADGSGTVCDALPLPAGSEGPVNTPTCGDGIDNDCDGMTDTADADCAVEPPLSFKEDFESGRLGSQWGTKSTGSGRIQVAKNSGPCGGKYHLTMDASRSNRYSLNELVLTMNLTGKTGVTLGFNHKEYGDEDHVMPAVFSGSSNSDGVAISADGQTWYRIQGLTSADGTSSSCRSYMVNLDAAAASAGIGYTSTFRIKFQQYDNYPISSDGFAFDDIDLYSSF